MTRIGLEETQVVWKAGTPRICRTYARDGDVTIRSTGNAMGGQEHWRGTYPWSCQRPMNTLVSNCGHYEVACRRDNVRSVCDQDLNFYMRKNIILHSKEIVPYFLLGLHS